MIYVTGDCHGGLRRFNKECFPEQKQMTKNDYVIVCGDFGLIWEKDCESKQEKYDLDLLNNRSFTTLFCDGNHENFDRLNSYPVTEWHGGKVHMIRPSVIHLMRGQIYDICDKSIFVFGGAKSHDIDGGILETDDPYFHQLKTVLDRKRICYRINHVSWWKEELPSYEEMQEGLRNLKKHDNKVDFVITHCCSSSTQAILGYGTFAHDIETDYLEKVKQNVEFSRWFFGHYHDNRQVNEKEILLYEQMIRIA